jgi:lycopene beta-cyclase
MVEGIAPNPVEAPWPNTYGIWAKELEPLGLEDLLEHRWSNTVSFYGAGGTDLDDQPTPHGLDYGLFDRQKLQQYWLGHGQGMTWHQDSVERISLQGDCTSVHCASGDQRLARVVIDASGHRSPTFVGLIRAQSLVRLPTGWWVASAIPRWSRAVLC